MTEPAPPPAPGPVAIIGAGPIGLDAALAAYDRGWPFTAHEAESVGAHVRMHTYVCPAKGLTISARAERTRRTAARQWRCSVLPGREHQGGCWGSG